MMMNALLFWLDSTRPRTNVQCLLGQKETSSKIVLSVEHVSSISIYTVRVNDGFAMERVSDISLISLYDLFFGTGTLDKLRFGQE